MLVEGSVTATVFEQWLKEMLLKELEAASIIVIDNASIHRKTKIIEILKGHDVCFLPPYSPDFNKIEHAFGALKKIRNYSPNKSLDEIIAGYGN